MLASKQPRLTCAHHRMNGGVLVRLLGSIDETFDASGFVSGLEGVVVLDLDQVTQATSFGVREWISALGQLSTQRVFFVRARPALVSQFNMVRGFGGQGKLVSLYLPYLCASCEESFDLLLDLRAQHEVLETFQPPPALCPKCGKDAEFDDIPESYLSFVSKQPSPQTPPLFEALLSSAASPATGLFVEKEVSGDLTGLWLKGVLDGRDYLRRAADGIQGALLLSMEGVTSFVDAGLDRIVSFVARVGVPTTLYDIPIELAERLVASKELAGKSWSVRSVVSQHECPKDGKFRVSHSRGAWSGVAKATCPLCGNEAKAALSLAQLEAVSKCPVAEASTGEANLLQAHALKHAELTPLVTPTPGSLSRGAIVMGRYLYERPLGQGGMAEVFLAKQLSLGGFEKPVVVKRILPGLAVDQSFVDMFLHEARIAARIDHPNVVQIYDLGREAAQHFIVMEYVNGWDLAVVLRAAKKEQLQVPLVSAVRIIRDVALALDAAHRTKDPSGEPSPIVHRDVSPQNILISREGRTKLTDFGIAKAADTLSGTPTGVVKGKTPYLAPEALVRGHEQVAPSVDIFATGIVLYQLLTGINPFRKDTEVATMTAILQEEPVRPSQLRPEVPRQLDEIMLKALEKNPDQRYATSGEFADALQGFLDQYFPTAFHSELTLWLGTLGLP